MRPDYKVFLSLLHGSAHVHRSLSDGRSWGKNGAYKVNDGYRMAVDRQNNIGIDRKWSKVWCKDGLSKVNVFYWILAHRKTLTTKNLRKRGVVGPMRCILCKNAEESLEHLFIDCKFSQEVWQRMFKDLDFYLTLPTNWSNFFSC